MNTAVFYDGPSQLTGAPIVGVVTGLTMPSCNAKTGDMAQVWILVRDHAPNVAIADGSDEAVCGDCALRGDGVHGRGCYVTYWQAPVNIYKRLRERPRVAPRQLAWQLRGRSVRLGAYGDPAAIPLRVWTMLLWYARASIGYTQQWRTCDPGFRRLLMASVLDSVATAEARALGWRTYRVRGPLDPLRADECICPASAEAGHKLTCEACLLCNGTGDDRGRANPVIIAHGRAGNLKVFGVRPTTKFGRPSPSAQESSR